MFNVYLEESLKTCPALWRAVLKGDLLAFADDILYIVDNIKEAKLGIRELELLKDSVGLQLNKDKTHLLTDAKDFRVWSVISSIKIVT